MTEDRIRDHASALLDAFDTAAPLAPLTASEPALTVPDAYRIAFDLMGRRIARGERPIGWKIGFTNRTIWDEYDVHAPIWGVMYDSGLTIATGAQADCRIAHLHEPRIEPEIAFRISRTPTPGMDEAALLGCFDAVAHGVEIVQSPYPGWVFRPVDTMAAGALHGAYVLGPWLGLAGQAPAPLLRDLASFTLTLRCDDGTEDRGHAANVLDSPLSALRHFVDGISECPFGRGILPGDIITTGTVTRAFPVVPGQIWTTHLQGLALPGLTLRFL
ncbi:2-keto-4-pentenoate hydratase [Gemmobacter nectariphilus]|uniref:2-keto-4-pentenoate hydratase n=1 Tax=Gemmobacter nectariphilus TaxID=220343 RepID=UPI00040FF4CD|nr:fumarylacetoacetate hydrolase family protein [Gemmobacter nectariphilus]